MAVGELFFISFSFNSLVLLIKLIYEINCVGVQNELKQEKTREKKNEHKIEENVSLLCI